MSGVGKLKHAMKTAFLYQYKCNLFNRFVLGLKTELFGLGLGVTDYITRRILKRLKQKDHEVKAWLGCRESQRPAWATS